MCGRFTLTATIDQLFSRYDIESFLFDDEFGPNYNVAPSQSVVAVIHNGEINKMGYLKWGLIPPWTKDAKIANKLINARAETVAKKPSFRHAFRRKRCLIPADSFYEWKRNEDGTKTPMRIKLKSGDLFSMAGLWEQWTSPEGASIFTCTVITTEANKFMRDIHNRMPVILNPDEEKLWLDPAMSDQSSLSELLNPFDPDLMEAYEVSSQVNSPKNNSIELIRKIC